MTLGIYLMNDSPPQASLSRLREILTLRFDAEELHSLCFDLGVDYDNLRGEGKAAKARELVAYMNRRNRLSDLVEVSQRLRPDISWDEWPHRPSSIQQTSDPARLNNEQVSRDDRPNRPSDIKQESDPKSPSNEPSTSFSMGGIFGSFLDSSSPHAAKEGFFKKDKSSIGQEHNVDQQQSVRVLTIFLILLNVMIAVVTNIATGILPEQIKPYLWLSWPILGVLVLIYIYLNWLSTKSQSFQGPSSRAKMLAQKALRTAAQRVTIRMRLAWILEYVIQSIYLARADIGLMLHRRRLKKKISDLEKIAIDYSEAIKQVEKAKEKGEVSGEVAEKAINSLDADFHIAMEKLVPSAKTSLPEEHAQ